MRAIGSRCSGLRGEKSEGKLLRRRELDRHIAAFDAIVPPGMFGIREDGPDVVGLAE